MIVAPMESGVSAFPRSAPSCRDGMKLLPARERPYSLAKNPSSWVTMEGFVTGHGRGTLWVAMPPRVPKDSWALAPVNPSAGTEPYGGRRGFQPPQNPKEEKKEAGPRGEARQQSGGSGTLPKSQHRPALKECLRDLASVQNPSWRDRRLPIQIWLSNWIAMGLQYPSGSDLH